MAGGFELLLEAHQSWQVTPLSLPLHRLKTDLEPVPRRFCEPHQRARRGLAASVFEPRHGALRGFHPAREFGLAEAGRRHALAIAGVMENSSSASYCLR